MLAVSDTGVGMDSDSVKRIFEPGYSSKGSNGLGLASVDEILRSMGGRMRVRSTPGHGTTFEALLPRYGERGEGPVSQIVCK